MPQAHLWHQLAQEIHHEKVQAFGWNMMETIKGAGLMKYVSAAAYALMNSPVIF